MGLTIHYTMKSKLTKLGDIRALVKTIRQFALDLPFAEVEDVVDFQGKDVDFEDPDDPDRWLKVQSGQYVEDDGGRISCRVEPLHIVAFATSPGEGCEPANFGLCRYPASILTPRSQRRLRTNLSGWRWSSFCKTQYASDPACGGVGNFLRCHLLVVKLLDFIQRTGLVEVEVSDEGGYWDKRDLGELAKEVGRWNEFIAAFASQVKDAAEQAGLVGESAIAGFANFEHLEARGMRHLKDLGLLR